MPMRQCTTTHSFTDHPYDPGLHEPGTKGRDGQCTLPGCVRLPLVSRHWDNPEYEDGWWGAYCADHAYRYVVEAR